MAKAKSGKEDKWLCAVTLNHWQLTAYTAGSGRRGFPEEEFSKRDQRISPYIHRERALPTRCHNWQSAPAPRPHLSPHQSILLIHRPLNLTLYTLTHTHHHVPDPSNILNFAVSNPGSVSLPQEKAGKGANNRRTPSQDVKKGVSM